MRIEELVSAEQWQAAFPILQQLRQRLTEEDFLSRREELLESGYLLFGLYENDKIVSVASAIIYPHVTRGKDFWIHDLVSDEGVRSKGFGKAFLNWLEDYAQSKGCSRVCVHTRNTNDGSKHFYGIKCEYDGYATVFQKDFRE